jgi:serine/alanine racemase
MIEDLDLETDRAWIEINLDNLEHNINEIKKVISHTTKIMAVIKANAYGHGTLLIAKKLLEIGINDFAVATLEEGINLRKNNIDGNILILGYTNFIDLKYVIKYDLIQTIVDYDYSERIKELDLDDKLKCHIKINTGMNRIGERYDSIDKISKIYENEKLNILGTFSHLCVADSKKTEDIEFSKKQIKRFNECIKTLKDKGYDTGKVHLQSSYGTINYVGLNYDYVRMGILMYGVNSSKQTYQLNNLNLKPVLSVKARITSIKDIEVNDSVSYGRTYIASQKRKIASISIGYADGIPRNLSNKDMIVKVNDGYGKAIGRICMDQMLIDITDLSNIKVGDIATIIGDDKKISAEEVSDKADTITNELLCRLGSRLKRIIKEK